MANTEMAFEPLLTTYKYVPLGSTATATGAVPVDANGDPASGVRTPLVASMANADTSLSV